MRVLIKENGVTTATSQCYLKQIGMIPLSGVLHVVIPSVLHLDPSK